MRSESTDRGEPGELGTQFPRLRVLECVTGREGQEGPVGQAEQLGLHGRADRSHAWERRGEM